MASSKCMESFLKVGMAYDSYLIAQNLSHLYM